MTKGFSLKKIIVGLFILLSLFMIMPQTVHAELWVPGTGGENEEEGNENAGGGPTYARTGFLLTLVGDKGTPILGSQVVFYPYNNNMPAPMGGSITTEYFDVSVTKFVAGSPINQIPAFTGSSAGGPLVQAFLLSPCTMGGDSSYTNNAEFIIVNHLGVTIKDLQEYLVDNEAYVQITPIFWCRKQGATKASKGDWFIGNANNWQQANPYKSYISMYTHRVFPQCTTLTEPWWGLQPCTTYKLSGDFYLSEWGTVGIGIGGIRCKTGFQVVLCFESPDGWQTQYLSSGNLYNVLPKIGEMEIQPDSGYVSKTFTKSTSPTATYSEVKSGTEQIGGLFGTGTFNFLDRTPAKGLFLHYKGELPPPETTDTDLYAWELSVRIPGEKPGSTTEKRTDMSIEHHSFNEMQQRVVAWQDEHVFEHELEKQVEVERSVAKDHDYKLSQDHGQFNIDGGIWQLYRGEYIDKWVYFKDLASTIWTVDDKIDPNYAYYLCRSHLESLGLVIDRGASGTAGLYLSTPNAFVEGYDGVLGKEPQKANTLQTWEGVAPYTYQYIPTWTGSGAWIVVDRYTRQILPHTYESREEKIDYEIQIFYAD